MTDNRIGSRVRLAREQRGLTLGDVARSTKLPTSVLEAIEGNHFANLPAGMYRKAYLRTVAAEVGLDPSEIAAAYDTQFEAPVESATTVNGYVTVPDRWVEELRPSPRPTIVTVAVLATLSVAWFVLRPDPGPAAMPIGNSGSEAEPFVMRTPIVPDRTVVTPAPVQTPITTPEMRLTVDLTTTGWCWVAADSDGERVVYRLIEPGSRVVVEGRRRISLRLGNAGSVRLSINGGPRRTPGADGEVVELEVNADALQQLNDGAVETES